MYNWYILKSTSRYWSQICYYLISNLVTCNFLSINIKFLQQDRLFSKEKCFGTKRHLLQNRYDDQSADVTLTILSRMMLEILIGCWKIAGEYVISNRITFLTMTVTGHVVRWLDFTSLKAQLPAGFQLLFSLSINNHRCMSSSAFRSLSLSKERGYGRDFHGHPHVFQWPIVIVSWLIRNKIARKPILLYRDRESRIVRIFVSRILRKYIHISIEGIGKTKTAGKISVAQ